jgi:hypothetical protein
MRNVKLTVAGNVGVGIEHWPGTYGALVAQPAVTSITLKFSACDLHGDLFTSHSPFSS